MTSRLLPCALALLLLTACKGEEQPKAPTGPASEEVERIYNLFVQGRYEAYVDEMASCDSMPTAYRQQMIDLFKQHAHLQRQRNGGAVKGTVERMDVTPNGLHANVFLRVIYADQSHEEIMLPMVKVDDRWRLE